MFVNAVEVPVVDVHLLEKVVLYTNRLTISLCLLCYFIVFTISFCEGGGTLLWSLPKQSLLVA
jgi:hypothetical protein